MQTELFEVLKKINRLEPGIEKSLIVKTTPASPPRLEPAPQNEVPATPHTETTPQNEEPAPPQTEPTPQYLCKPTRGDSHFHCHGSPMFCNMSNLFCYVARVILDSLAFFSFFGHSGCIYPPKVDAYTSLSSFN